MTNEQLESHRSEPEEAEPTKKVSSTELKD